jgi:hypothetical protein
MYQVATTYKEDFNQWFSLVRWYRVGNKEVMGLSAVARELRNLYVPRRLVRVALSQIKDGSHTCVYGGKWGKDLVEVVRI